MVRVHIMYIIFIEFMFPVHSITVNRCRLCIYMYDIHLVTLCYLILGV